MIKLEALRSKVLEIAQKASAVGLMPLTMGNFSARDPETGLMAITPTGRLYDELTPADVSLVTLDRELIDGLRPSCETPMHTHIYRMRPEVNGIVHTHSIYANTFGVARMEIPQVLNVMKSVGGSVPIAPFERNATLEFGQHALEAMGDRNAVILANHGLLTVGPNIGRAFALAVFVEQGAQVYYQALQVGTPHPI